MAKGPKSTSKKKTSKAKKTTGKRGRPSGAQIKSIFKSYMTEGRLVSGPKYVVNKQGPKTSKTKSHYIIKSRKTGKVLKEKVFPKGGGTTAKQYNKGKKRAKSVRNESAAATKRRKTNLAMSKFKGKNYKSRLGPKKSSSKKKSAKSKQMA